MVAGPSDRAGPAATIVLPRARKGEPPIRRIVPGIKFEFDAVRKGYARQSAGSQPDRKCASSLALGYQDHAALAALCGENI